MTDAPAKAALGREPQARDAQAQAQGPASSTPAPAPMDPQALAQACADAMWADDAATHGLGMQIDRIAPGQSAISMSVDARMVNGHGLCHGGFIFALADSAFAFACNTYGQRSVAQHCSVTFLAPAHLGDRLTATAQEVARGARSGVYDVQVATSDGTLIAVFRGHSRTIKGTLVGPGSGTPSSTVSGGSGAGG